MAIYSIIALLAVLYNNKKPLQCESLLSSFPFIEEVFLQSRQRNLEVNG